MSKAGGSNPQAGATQPSTPDPNPLDGGGQTNAGQPGTSPTPPNPLDGAEGWLSPDKARELQRENQSLRARAKQIDDAAQQAADAQLSEAQKLSKQNTDLLKQVEKLTADNLRHALREQIAQHGGTVNLADQESAALWLQSEGKLKLNGAGDGYENVAELLQALVQARPNLALTSGAPISQQAGNLSTGRPPAPPTGGGPTNPSPFSHQEPLSWEYIQKLGREFPDEYARRRAEIQDFLGRINLR
jgi:gas vesicle protein